MSRAARFPWLAGLGLVAAAAAWMSWPRERLDPGLLMPPTGKYDARILRDRWGVPHMFGASDQDVAYGLAWAHAEDDFRTIQDSLLATRGKLAAVYGRKAAPSDYLVHLLRVWESVHERYERDLAPDTRALLEAYAAGLNHYAALHPDDAEPILFPVTGKDLAAGTLHKLPIFFGLDAVLKDLTAPERAHPSPSPPRFGSNAFAVAPRRSADGHTRLVVNSHQPWEGVAAWYEVHLHSGQGWDAAGGLFPGAPVVLHGHNRRLGWAHTVNFPDLVDVYRLEVNPENERQYRFEGSWRDFEVGRAPIDVKLLGRGRWTFRREILWSVHGPALKTPHGVYALRIAGLGEVRALEQWYRMNKARSLDEWMGAMAMAAVPMFSTVYADADGNIAYLYGARLPRRTRDHDWTRDLPGDSQAAIWSDYMSFDRLPRVVAPASGFVQSCNNTPFQATLGAGRPDPGRHADLVGIETQMTNRALRALELLGDDDSITREELEAYKYDVAYSADSEVEGAWRRLAQAPAPSDPLLREALDVLRSWDRRADADNTAAALALMTLSPGYKNDPLPDVPALLSRLASAAATLRRHFGTLRPRWQDVQRLRRGALDVGLSGGPDLMRAVYGQPAEDGRLVANAGDSYVMFVEWDGEGRVRSRSIHQFGAATRRPASPHFADQAPLFARQQLKPVWLDEADIRANLEREYRPGETAARR